MLPIPLLFSFADSTAENFGKLFVHLGYAKTFSTFWTYCLYNIFSPSQPPSCFLIIHIALREQVFLWPVPWILLAHQLLTSKKQGFRLSFPRSGFHFYGEKRGLLPIRRTMCLRRIVSENTEARSNTCSGLRADPLVAEAAACKWIESICG